MNDIKKFTITAPEPFVLGSGQTKMPGGYICKVLLTSTQEVVFEVLESTPQFAQKSCIMYCIADETGY